jgi:hypothetical protein
MQYLGDIERTQSDIRFRFNTRTAAGVPVDGVGLAAVVYKDGSVTEITGAVTLTVPFDSRTGLVSVYVDASGASFTPGSNYSVVLSAGTVNGVSVAGVCVAEFSIEYRNTRANVIAMEPNVITASAIADNAITDAKVASDVTIASVTGSVGSVAGNVSGSVGSVVGNVGGNVAGSVASVVGAVGSVTGLNVAHIDAAISSRATDSLLITVAGYLDTEIAAIKAKTDQLTFTAAGFVDCNLYRWRGTQPGNLDSNSFVPSNLAAVNGSSTRADTLSAALDGNYLSKLNVSGTLAHTDNATSFMADVSALATKIDVTNAGLL